MTRNVLLPNELDGRLDTLTNLVEEINGILLYRQNGIYCPIEALFMTGIGSAGHVQSQSDRMEIANEFFKRNPDYKFVKFHTHSRGTIEKFGSHYARHFSQGDIDGMKEQLRYDKNFMAMLVTPETKLLSGIDNPKLLVVDNSLEYINRSQIVSASLKNIAENLGYDLSKFRATKK
ncbi:MAG: hypothetical protein ACP5N1_01325 [Candidatus Woesearchaeota archaeon]